MDFAVPDCRFIKLIGIELEGGWLPNRMISPYGDGSVHDVPMPDGHPQCPTIQNRLQGYADPATPLCPGCAECTVAPVTQAEWSRYIGACDYGQCRPSLPWESPDRCDWCRRQVRQYRAVILSERTTLRRILTGEICSVPLFPTQGIEWLLRNYPDSANNTCGMHVHVSFGSSILRYSQLMDQEFWEFFRVEYAQWARAHVPAADYFWERWNGNNTFCQPNFRPDLQVPELGKGGNRYSLFNYCFSIQGPGGRGNRNRAMRGDLYHNARKTIECRVFPVFKDKTLAAAAVCELLRLIEKFLHEKSKTRRSDRVTETVIFEGDLEQVVAEVPPYMRYA